VRRGSDKRHLTVLDAAYEVEGNATVQVNFPLSLGQTATIKSGTTTIATTGTITGQYNLDTSNTPAGNLPKIIIVSGGITITGGNTYTDHQKLVFQGSTGTDLGASITIAGTYVLTNGTLSDDATGQGQWTAT
jgi:hypothetical protein